MKIYIAGPEIHNIDKMGGQLHNILLSYWDWVGPIPFRKPTFKILIPTLSSSLIKGEKIKCQEKEQKKKSRKVQIK